VVTLYLPMRGIYFDQIKSGEKTEEYRLFTTFWAKRLVNRHYDQIILMKGYPTEDEVERRIVRPWRGYRKTTITHEHFGPDPVMVYAIRVN
jgi:hypothetical protein